MMFLLAADNPLSHVVQHIAKEVPGLENSFFRFPLISNHIIMQVIAALLVMTIIPLAARRREHSDAVMRMVPRGLSNAIEAICVAIRDQVVKPNLGKYTDVFLPYIWSLFFFLLVSNILGMIPLSDWFAPVVGTQTAHLIGGTSTGNIWVTSTFATITLIMMIYNGLRYHGGAYIGHFFMGPAYLAWFIAILEFLGLIFKGMALAVRLFANMVGGHILLAVLLGFVDSAWKVSPAAGGAIGFVVVLGSVAIYFLEIFVAFLHAFIFTVLTSVFLGLSVNIHHDEHEHEAHGHEHGADAHAAH